MASRFPGIQRLVSGGLIVNYRCTASCGHCLYACGPRRKAGYMTPETARRALRTIRDMGCRSVHIGGGEPFLDIPALCAVLDAARACEAGIEYVETNAFWARSIEDAAAALTPLQAHGLKTILLSVDPFHSASVPLSCVDNALAACDRLGIHAFTWRMEFAEDIRKLGAEATHSMADYESEFGPGYFTDVMKRYGLVFGGRMAETFAGRMPRRPACELATQPSPCGRLADTNHFHVDLNGLYIPGLCTGLAIRLEDISAPGDAGMLTAMLHEGGITALHTWACDEHNFRPDAAGYVNACHLCLDIRTFLVSRSESVYPELAPADFYRAIASRFN
jgi:hypothetical protein